MEIEITAARPEHRGPIAELMYSSGTDIYDYLYASRAVDFLRYEFLSGLGFAGHANVTVALHEREVVGTGCFYDRDSYRELMNGTVKNYFGHFGKLRALPVLWRSRHVRSVVRAPKPGELYLANFAVASQLRSQGIGAKLILHKLDEARRNGYRIFGLDVSTNNPRGQALYTRLGMQVTKEKVFSNPNAGVPPVRKMELPL